MKQLIAPMLLVASFCFALGITLPLIAVDRLFVFSEEPSLVAIVSGLWTEGDRALAAVVALFSLVLPALKLLLLHAAAYDRNGTMGHLSGRLHALARWSMLDVVLVAIVIFAAKTSGLATAISKPGLWFFAASVVFTAAVSAAVERDRKTGLSD